VPPLVFSLYLSTTCASLPRVGRSPFATVIFTGLSMRFGIFLNASFSIPNFIPAFFISPSSHFSEYSGCFEAPGVIESTASILSSLTVSDSFHFSMLLSFTTILPLSSPASPSISDISLRPSSETKTFSPNLKRASLPGAGSSLRPRTSTPISPESAGVFSASIWPADTITPLSDPFADGISFAENS